MKDFVKRQLTHIREEGIRAVLRKARKLILIPIVLPVVITVRLIKPFLLIRFGVSHYVRIGHFLINTEVYLCERDAGYCVSAKHYVDIFGIGEKPCNNQVTLMWRRILNFWPLWIVYPIIIVNRAIPFGHVHEIPHSLSSSGTGRDINNLLNVTEKHLYFTDEEHTYGEKCLRKMGIPEGALFVCLNVRDNAYLESNIQNYDWNYHNYRDTDIDNYVLAAEELAERDYFVIRMGAKVHKAFQSLHTKVIDYATNGMRTDFMDIYLGANCEFAVSTGSGWDNVPYVFRRPIVYVNHCPIGEIETFNKDALIISQHYCSKKEGCKLTLREIFTQGVGFLNHNSEYSSKGIELIEDTPEEIRDICVEMASRLNGEWQSQKDDEDLQKQFWDIFPRDSKNEAGVPLHGEISSGFGSDFLRNNRWWLQ